MGRHRLLQHVPDDIVFAVCAQFIAERKSATDVDRWLKENYAKELDRLVEEHGISVTREVIYPLLQEGLRRNFLVLRPPEQQSLAENLKYKYGTGDRSIQVLNVRGLGASEHVAAAGAQVVLELIKKLGRKKDRVHLGLGAGFTTLSMARQLARLLQSEPDYPRLVLHALTSGFSVEKPHSAPVSFFSLFDQARVDGVGLFAPAVVACGDYRREKGLPGVRESFALAGEIDIVMTSLARAHHAHGLLNRFLDLKYPAAEKTAQALAAAGWVGDVQFLPYSASGPIGLNTGIRPVTLFELPALVKMAQQENKYVVLVAGPCGQCGETKTPALVPLLDKETLRVWTHLVTDIVTAREALREEKSV